MKEKYYKRLKLMNCIRLFKIGEKPIFYGYINKSNLQVGKCKGFYRFIINYNDISNKNYNLENTGKCYILYIFMTKAYVS